MRIIGSVLAGMCVMALPLQSQATTIVSQTFTCPVGGETFDAAAYGSWFGYGGRPDGKPLGTGRGYVAVPECPGNHLLLYRDFSTEEIKALTEIISSAEYQQLVIAESDFYRVAWLEHALNPQSPQYVWYLLQATWYVDKDKDRKTRYRERFMAVAEGMPVTSTDITSMRLRLRVINVYRETGQFELALAGLQGLPIKETARGLPVSQAAANRLDDQAQDRWYFVREARQLEKLIRRQDISVNPIDVLPDWMAEEECYFRQPKTAFETAFCSTPKMRKRLAEDKEMFEEERAYYDYDGPISAPPPPPTEPEPPAN